MRHVFSFFFFAIVPLYEQHEGGGGGEAAARLLPLVFLSLWKKTTSGIGHSVK